MNAEKRQYTVDIFKQEYTLVSDEGEMHVLQAAAMVDTLMKQLAARSPSADHKRIAVLVALKLASDLAKARYQLEEITNKQSDLVERMDRVFSSISL